MKRLAVIFIAILAVVITAAAQDEVPTISPSATFTKPNGEIETGTECSSSAPLQARFEANPMDVGAWSENYEWRFTRVTETSREPYLVRYERDTEYTFTQSGEHTIVCYAVFTLGNDTVAYTQNYWSDIDPLRVTIEESKLEMPNAFSPNEDDDINKIYKAKSNYQSIVEFKAVIYNRWGQKLFEWTDPAEGWDGTYKGNPCKQGVYFVEVKAKGADGKKYHIRRDVNLLRGYKERESSGASTP